MSGKRRSLIIVAALALGSCGGDDSGGGTVASAPIPTPTPTPVPSPTPTPTATPAPPASPAFGFTTAFTRTTQVGVSFTEFRALDTQTNTTVTRLIDAKLLDSNSKVTITFKPQPEQVALTFGNADYAFSAGDVTVAGDRRSYTRAGRAVGIALGGGTTVELALTSFSALEVTATDGGQTGVARQLLLAPFGNVSPIQTVIDGPIFYNAAPVILGGDIYAGESLAQVRSIGTGVSIQVFLSRNVNATQQSAGSVALRGTLDPLTNLIQGEVFDGSTDAPIGSFNGALYGPSRDRISVAFQFRRSQDGNRLYAGYYLASRR